jgi:hypothetical protein
MHEQKGQASGADALNQILEGVDFPKSKQQLISEVGDEHIQMEEGRHMSVKEVLQDCSHDTFNNAADVMSCPEIKQNIKAA